MASESGAPDARHQVGLLLPSASGSAIADRASAFCARGVTTALVPLLPGSGAGLEAGSPVIVLEGEKLPATSGHPQWRLTDDAGVPLASSPRLSQALESGLPSVEVQLRNMRDEILSEARVSTGSSFASTVQRCLTVVGPMAVVAANNNSPKRGRDSHASRSRSSSIAEFRSTVRFVGRRARAAVTVREWSIVRFGSVGLDALLEGSAPSIEGGSSAPAGHFWADPCVAVADDGTVWVFVEELDRRTGLGHIRACRWDGRQLIPGPVCLRTDHHLSFPQVYRVGDTWMATVETCARLNRIYTFGRLGETWRVHPDHEPLPAHVTDPVLAFDPTSSEPRSWIGTDAATDPDAVFVSYERSDSGGEWIRDDRSVFIDVHHARGGGSWDAQRDIRAVQDCGGVYGAAVALVRRSAPREGLVTLTGDSVSPSRAGRAWSGVHTLSWSSDGVEVWGDAWRNTPHPLGGLLRLKERHHVGRCRGE